VYHLFDDSIIPRHSATRLHTACVVRSCMIMFIMTGLPVTPRISKLRTTWKSFCWWSRKITDL